MSHLSPARPQPRPVRLTLTATLGLLIGLTLALGVCATPAQATSAGARVATSRLKVTGAGASSATITWAMRARSHTFSLTYSQDRSFRRARHDVVRGHRVRLRGLQPGHRYFVRVRPMRRAHGHLVPGYRKIVRSFVTATRSTSAPVQVPGSPVQAPSTSRLPWLSGASLSGVATDPAYAAWRGRAMTITGTWNDNYEGQIYQWSVDPKYNFNASHWQSNLDDAIGGIYKDRGETWAAAATGAYDQRWTNTLTSLAQMWGDRPGTLYIRFAHEFNGSWYQWNVTPSETSNFKTAWRRFRALQQRLFPTSKLVFCTNSESSATMGTDWRNAFPGKQYVDVISTDYYNQWPFIATQNDWDTTANKTDQWGAPRGLEAHRKFAQTQGLPFALSEWSSNGDMGDSPLFMTNLFNWLTTNAGTGPGNVLYEIQFNVEGYSDNYQLYPYKKQPRASTTYQKLWGHTP